MFEATRARLAALATFRDQLGEVAIAVATEQRNKVKSGRKRGAARRKQARAKQRELRGMLKVPRGSGQTRAGRLSALAAYTGMSEGAILRQLRRIKGASRTGSGISIDARATDEGVTLSASNQVSFLRRKRSETSDLNSVFRERLLARLLGGG